MVCGEDFIGCGNHSKRGTSESTGTNHIFRDVKCEYENVYLYINMCTCVCVQLKGCMHMWQHVLNGCAYDDACICICVCMCVLCIHVCDVYMCV